MSKYATQQYNKYLKLQQALKECYSRAKTFSSSQPELTEMKKNLVFNTSFQKLSSFYRGRITGYDEALWNHMQEELLEYKFCYFSKNNRKTIVSKYEYLPMFIRKKNLFSGVHYWKNTLNPFNKEPTI